jgi:sialate O-acetylesterase
VPVWGTAIPGEQVSVEFAGQIRSTVAGPDGKWQVVLVGLKTGAPQTLTVTANNTLTIQDVLVGEVWLGSGQSNMAMTVNRAKNFAHEQRTAKVPLIRHFKEESPSAKAPQAVGSGRWVLCSPETVGTFSAALYFFGREIHQVLNVPVGLINSSVGGTPIEAWIAPEAQRASEELKPFFAAMEIENVPPSATALKKYERDLATWEMNAKKARNSKKAPRKPQNPMEVYARKSDIGGLFNGKIAPLIPYAIRGMLWYQGEANSTPAKAPFYHAQLSLLVRDWRARWGHEFPIAWAQLPNFAGPGRDWPRVREAMLKTLTLPKTGMAITIDIGEANDIHPKNKQDVGRRFALWALGDVYGLGVPATSGPLPAGHTIRGNEIVVTFTHTNGGLVARGGELKGFVIAGADQQWQPAQARIQESAVVVTSPDVTEPLAVRYAWENLPSCNLYNGAGLPASPFRTDNWK